MWAQRLAEPFRFTEIETPTPTEASLADGQVLLRMLAGGLCGTDLPFFRGQLPLPWGTALTHEVTELPGFPMHEIVGEVVASRSAAVRVGERVVGWASRSDGLAEYVVTDADAVAVYDRGLPASTAVMLQPLACVLEAAGKIPFAGRNVAILGVGPIGLLFGHVARRRGARRVQGVDRVARGDFAPDFGFDEMVQATSDRWVAELDDGDRPDIVVEAIGHQPSTFVHAAEALAGEGLLYYFGIPDDLSYSVPMQTLVRKNVTVMAGITVRKRAALRLADDYLAEHRGLAERFITHRLDMAKVTEAYSLATAPAPGRAKIVLEMAR